MKLKMLSKAKEAKIWEDLEVKGLKFYQLVCRTDSTKQTGMLLSKLVKLQRQLVSSKMAKARKAKKSVDKKTKIK